MTLSLWTSVCLSVGSILFEVCSYVLIFFFFFVVDGETAARMIKSTNNSNRETPIIAVTAYERTVQLAGAFDDILSKPVTKGIISQRLKQFCKVHVSEPNVSLPEDNKVATTPAMNSS